MIEILLKIFVCLFITSIANCFIYKGILLIKYLVEEFKDTKDKQDKADLIMGIILIITIIGLIFIAISFGIYNIWI